MKRVLLSDLGYGIEPDARGGWELSRNGVVLSVHSSLRNATAAAYRHARHYRIGGAR